MDKKWVVAGVVMALISVPLLIKRLVGKFRFVPIYKKTFTWIGHHVDETFAEWCRDLGFTDVVSRYDEDEPGSANNLGAVGIAHWHFSPSYIYKDLSPTVEVYKAKILEELATAPTGKIFVDDTYSLYAWRGRDAIINFLEAVRQLHNDDIMLCFALMSQSDLDLIRELGSALSGLNFEVYHPPTMTIDEEAMSVLGSTDAKSVGHVLWAWGWEGRGVTWETMTENLVRKIYTEAENYGFSRITVFTGHETDEHEVGMEQTSLYNYPEFWDLIRSLNEAFTLA
jgi:hypothetical protein